MTAPVVHFPASNRTAIDDQHEVGYRVGNRREADRQRERAFGIRLHEDHPRQEAGGNADDQRVDYGSAIAAAAFTDHEGEGGDHERDPAEVEGVGQAGEGRGVGDVEASVVNEVTDGVDRLTDCHQAPGQDRIRSPPPNANDEGNDGRRVDDDVERIARCPIRQPGYIRVSKINTDEEQSYPCIDPTGQDRPVAHPLATVRCFARRDLTTAPDGAHSTNLRCHRYQPSATPAIRVVAAAAAAPPVAGPGSPGCRRPRGPKL